MLQISYFVDGLSVMSILFYFGFPTTSKCYIFPNLLQYMGSVVPLTGTVTRQQVNVTDLCT